MRRPSHNHMYIRHFSFGWRNCMVYLIKQVLFQSIGYRIINVGGISLNPCHVGYVWSASENLLKMIPSGWVVLRVFFLNVASVDTLESYILPKNLVIVLK
jgi:hypothetical protein